MIRTKDTRTREKQHKRINYKRTLILLAVLSTVSLVTLVGAISMRGYYFPNEATPTTPITLVIQIDGEAWANGTIIDWGQVEAGTVYTKSLTVQNTGSVQVNVYIVVANLPEDWTLTWANNNTVVPPGLQTSGTLQLTVPDPMTQTTPQTWDMWVKATPA